MNVVVGVGCVCVCLGVGGWVGGWGVVVCVFLFLEEWVVGGLIDNINEPAITHTHRYTYRHQTYR